jgi:alpha-L-rhamnosidase
MRIAPRPGGGLTHAALAYETDRGRVRVAWRIANGAMTLEVIIPEGSEAMVEPPLHPDAPTLVVAGGRHSWTYDLAEGYGARPPYTMDTPLKTLAEDPIVWRSLTDVFAKHFPGIPIDGNAPEAAGYSLNAVLGFIPGASEELKTDMLTALEGEVRATSIDQNRS